jgi:hypothetical protein
MKNRIFILFRWILLLPATIVSTIGVGILMGLAYDFFIDQYIVPIVFDKPMVVKIVRKFYQIGITSIAMGVIQVITATAIAPAKKLETGVVTLLLFTSAAIFIIYSNKFVFEANYLNYSFIEYLISALLILFGGILTLLYYRSEFKNV